MAISNTFMMYEYEAKESILNSFGNENQEELTKLIKRFHSTLKERNTLKITDFVVEEFQSGRLSGGLLLAMATIFLNDTIRKPRLPFAPPDGMIVKSISSLDEFVDFYFEAPEPIRNVLLSTVPAQFKDEVIRKIMERKNEI